MRKSGFKWEPWMSPCSTSHPEGTSMEATGIVTSEILDITSSKLGLTEKKQMSDEKITLYMMVYK